MQKKHLSLFVILCVATLTQLYGLTDPWSNKDVGYNGAFYSIFGRNFVRYGFLESRLGPIGDTGYVPAESFHHYLNHPPLLPLCIGVSFKIFGVYEWAARLVSLLFSLGSLCLIYFLGNYLWNKRIACLATVIAALTPLFLFYGKHVEVFGPPLLFFTLLTLFSYTRWIQTGKWRFLLLSIFAFVAALFSEWDAYLLAFLLPIHLARQGKRSPLSKKFWIFPLVGIVCFCLLVGHAWSLFGEIPTKFPIEGLIKRQRIDTISAKTGLVGSSYLFPTQGRYKQIFNHLNWVLFGLLPESQTEPRVTFWDYLLRISLYLGVYLNPVVLFLGIFGISILFRRRTLDPGSLGRGILLVLFAVGFFRILFFYNAAWEHRYVFFMLLAPVSFAAALGLDRFFNILPHRRNVKGALGGLILLFLLFSAGSTFFLYQSSKDFSNYLLGEFVRSHAAFDDVVFTSAPRSYSTLYYSDRRVFFNVRSLQRFSRVQSLSIGKKRWLVVDPHFPLDQELQKEMKNHSVIVQNSRYQLVRLH